MASDILERASERLQPDNSEPPAALPLNSNFRLPGPQTQEPPSPIPDPSRAQRSSVEASTFHRLNRDSFAIIKPLAIKRLF